MQVALCVLVIYFVASFLIINKSFECYSVVNVSTFLTFNVQLGYCSYDSPASDRHLFLLLLCDSILNRVLDY